MLVTLSGTGCGGEVAIGHVEQGVWIADEPIDVALSVDLLHDALLVVVAQTPGQLVVVHGRAVLLETPTTGHLLRLDQLELHAPAGPGDAAGTGRRYYL